MSSAFDVSVVIGTYNRGHLIKGAIESVLGQEAGATAFEVIVVDNNSTDGTRQAVHSLTGRANGRLRYLFEPKQGVSYSRNLGVSVSNAPIVAFLDDDVRPATGWISTIQRLFAEYPEIGLVGGKVLPDWCCPPPRWLTRHHWMPLALLDYGDFPFLIDASTNMGLISANCAIRKDLLVKAGGFAPELQRVKDNIGSMEDQELFERLFQAGARGVYWPGLEVRAVTAAERLTRAYHRRWHFEHGRFYALYRSRRMEPTAVGRLFDVPAHMYRQMAADALMWLKYTALCRSSEAFIYENKLRFFAGFFSKRLRQCTGSGNRSRSATWHSSAP
jgi:glycosyltransferase involved in cell wall biosynthesis